MPLYVARINYDVDLAEATPAGRSFKEYHVRSGDFSVSLLIEGNLDQTQLQKLRAISQYAIDIVPAKGEENIYGGTGSPVMFMKNHPQQNIVHGLRQTATRRVIE